MKTETKQKEEYSVFLKHIDSEKEETSNFAKTLLIVVLIFGGFALGFLLFSANEKLIANLFGDESFVTKIIQSYAETKEKRHRADFGIPFMPRRQNILLLGVDSNGSNTDPWKATRSDTIILLNIDPASRSVNAISIPRDSKVYLPNDFGVQKINSAHAVGGIKMTKATVEETLGVKVDKYIIVHDEAVRRIIDAIGGVPIYVEKNMRYNDYSGGLHVNLQKGLNILDGTNAVGYLRFRKDGLGDIGRTQRQQWFMRGLLEKLQSPQTITKIPQILDVASTYIKTDLSLYELSQYAALSKSIDINKIEVATLPGAPNKKGYISYWILDPDKTQEVVNRLIYRDRIIENGHKFVAGIMYSPEKERQALHLKSQLQDLGFEVNCMGRASLPHSQFIAHSQSLSNEFFDRLKRDIPEIKNSQFVYDPIKNYCVNSDFTVILSGQ